MIRAVLRHSVVEIASLVLTLTPSSAPLLEGQIFGHRVPHYVFILPDGYVGWVKIVFQDRNANSMPYVNYRVTCEIPDSGIAHTSDYLAVFVGTKDEFFYRVAKPGHATKLIKVPDSYIVWRGAHGGYHAPNSWGQSWYFFVGPPAKRQEYRWRGDPSNHLYQPEFDPTPGRVPN